MKMSGSLTLLSDVRILFLLLGCHGLFFFFDGLVGWVVAKLLLLFIFYKGL